MRVTLALALFGLSCTLFSQVGINTDQPEALLHIDGKDTALNSLLKISELENNESKTRFIVLKNGNVGINEENPTNKLVISNDSFDGANNLRNTGLQLKNGAKMGARLVSDEEGNAYWDNNTFIPGRITPNSVNILNFDEYVNTNTEIHLVKGNWNVSLGIYGLVGNIMLNSSALDQLGDPANIIDTNHSIQCTAILKIKTTDSEGVDYFSDIPDSLYYIPNSNRSIMGSVGRSMNRLLIDGDFLLKVTEPTVFNVFVKCEKLGSGQIYKRIGNLFRSEGSSTNTNSWFYATPF